MCVGECACLSGVCACPRLSAPVCAHVRGVCIHMCTSPSLRVRTHTCVLGECGARQEQSLSVTAVGTKCRCFGDLKSNHARGNRRTKSLFPLDFWGLIRRLLGAPRVRAPLSARCQEHCVSGGGRRALSQQGWGRQDCYQGPRHRLTPVPVGASAAPPPAAPTGPPT